MNQTNAVITDLTKGPFKIIKKENVTSLYIKQHFGFDCKERNLEKMWDKSVNGKCPPPLKDPCRLEFANGVDEYKEALLKQLVTEPYSQKKLIPGWLKFFAGETVPIENNVIRVTTTSMNYTNLENFIACILNLQNFNDCFLKKEATIEVDWNSIEIKNMREIFCNHYFFDDFERQSHRYFFEIHFKLLVTLKTPVTPSSSLKKYSQSLKGPTSDNYVQILCDAAEYPGKFAYSTKTQKIYLKPQSFEEAADYFRKRFNRSRRLTLRDVFLITHQKCSNLLKDNEYTITKDYNRSKNKFRFFPEVILLLDFSRINIYGNYKVPFNNLKNKVDRLLKALDEFSKEGTLTLFTQQNRRERANYLHSFSSIHVDKELFTTYKDKYFDKVHQIFRDLQESFENISKIINDPSQDSCTQSTFVALIQKNIANDPLSYVDDKDEIIADFANALLNGF